MKFLLLFGTVLAMKQFHQSKKLQNPNGEGNTTDIIIESRTTNNISKDIIKRRRNDRAYTIYAILL